MPTCCELKRNIVVLFSSSIFQNQLFFLVFINVQKAQRAVGGLDSIVRLTSLFILFISAKISTEWVWHILHLKNTVCQKASYNLNHTAFRWVSRAKCAQVGLLYSAMEWILQIEHDLNGSSGTLSYRSHSSIVCSICNWSAALVVRLIVSQLATIK